MAVSVLGSSAGGTVYSGSTSTVSFNAGTGTDRVLYAWLWNTALVASAVSYGGAAMTLLHSTGNAQLWRLIAPPTGTNTLSATHSNASLDFVLVALAGVDQTTPNGAMQTSSGTSSSPASASITVTDGLALAFMKRAYAAGQAAPTITAPSTLRGAYRNSASENAVAGGSRTSTGTVAWSIVATVAWITTGFVVNAAVQPGDISGDVALDEVAPGGVLASSGSDLGGDVTLADVAPSGALGLQPGAYTVPALTNWGGSLQAAVTVAFVTFQRLADGVQVLVLADQVTDGGGNLSGTNAALLAGTTYMVCGWNADGSARFARPVVAT